MKFTCARPLLIINKLRSLNCAGEHNLPLPATSPKVNLLIINMVVKRSVAGEFHEVQARQFAGKGASEGLARLQARLSRCARRRDCGSGQARHPRLRAGGAARDGAAGPCGGTSGAEGLERAAACLHIAALEPGTSSPHQRTAPARDFAQQSWKGLEGRRGLGRSPGIYLSCSGPATRASGAGKGLRD